MAKKETIIYTQKQGLEKGMNYCAYQERSQNEVLDKLMSWGLSRDEAEAVVAKLITLNFLNEERFARAYAGGKFRMKKWGKNKIVNALKRKGISTQCIQLGLVEITDLSYLETLEKLINSKNEKLQEKSLHQRKNKIARYLLSKGYESSVVWEQLKELR